MRADGYADLRSYAVIGDGRTVALIASDGSIDWFPIPALDSPPPFAALLDSENGGSFELHPLGEFTVRRRYLPSTNVLQTTFSTKTGTVRVTDALATGEAGRLPWTELIRRVDGMTGTVRMRWRIAPGTVFNTASAWVQNTGNGDVLLVDDVLISVRGVDHGEAKPEGAAIHGTFTASKGSHHVVALSATHDEPLRVLTPGLLDRAADRTIRNWRTWSRQFDFDGEWAAQALRSALALKLLIHSPTGAIAASATTSLPESDSGGKNWDYRFAWVRDLAYTVRALIRFGLREETHAAVAWLLRTIRTNGPELAIFYNLDGTAARPSVTIDDVPGWRGIGPVVTGNDAENQLQLGVYGDLFEMITAYVGEGNVLDAGTARLLSSVADRTCDHWRERDSGMWELEDLEHYTSSKMGCWQALDRAVELARLGQISGDVERWTAEREAVRQWIETEGWNQELGSYVMYPGSRRLDASVLLHAPSGFDQGPKMSSTIDAITERLGAGVLVYRYDGMQAEEGTFVASAFWVVSALACVGRMPEARERMTALVALANDVGLYSEQMDATTHEFRGNLPQALSHLALINAVVTIDQLGRGTLASQTTRAQGRRKK
jgi:GH15 family glucan-1,4-alpha-glucosidase